MKFVWRILAMLLLSAMLFCCVHVSCVTLNGKVTVTECSLGHVPAKQIQEIEKYNDQDPSELDESEPGPLPTGVGPMEL